MNQETKDKLAAVLQYLQKLPNIFASLQTQISELRSDDEADALKIAELTAEVDGLKAEHTEIITVADELDAAAKLADQADGVE